MQRNELYEAIAVKYGQSHQEAVAIGELGELANALSKSLRGIPNRMSICEEVADVEICIEQIKRFYDKDGKSVASFKAFKLNRLRLFYIEGSDK